MRIPTLNNSTNSIAPDVLPDTRTPGAYCADKLSALLDGLQTLIEGLQAQIDAFNEHRRTDFERWARAEEQYKILAKWVASEQNKTTQDMAVIDVTSMVQTDAGWAVNTDNGLGVMLTCLVSNVYYSAGLLFVQEPTDTERHERYSSSGLYTTSTLMEHTLAIPEGSIVWTTGMTQVLATEFRPIV